MRSGAVWGSVFGLAIASSALSYTKLYRTQAQRNALASAFGSNKATAALFGPAPQLQTVAGFTVFKIGMTLLILGAVWGLLTSTRLLRGEEDEGRWEVLLAGRRPGGRPTGQALCGLAAGVVTLWAVTALITLSPDWTRTSRLPWARRSTSRWPWWPRLSCSWVSAQ